MSKRKQQTASATHSRSGAEMQERKRSKLTGFDSIAASGSPTYDAQVGVAVLRASEKQVSKEGASSKKQKAGTLDKPAAVNQNWIELQSKLHKHSVKHKEITSSSVTTATKLPRLPEPTSSDFSLTKLIAMDCEMVGVGYDGKKSVLARVSIVNELGNVLYDVYVRPSEFVTDFRTHVSGIRYKDIKQGENLLTVQKKVADLLSGRILVGHALRHDLKALLLSHPKSDIRDTCMYGPCRSRNGRPRSLRHLAELFLGVKIQDGAHSSVEDARAAMLLYLKFKEEWERSLAPTRRLQKIRSAPAADQRVKSEKRK